MTRGQPSQRPVFSTRQVSPKRLEPLGAMPWRRDHWRCMATMWQPRRIGAGFSNARWSWPRRPCAPIRPTPRRTSSPPTLLAGMLKPWVRSRRFAVASPARSATCSRRRLPSIPTSPKRTWPSAAGTPTSLVPDSSPDRCMGEACRPLRARHGTRTGVQGCAVGICGQATCTRCRKRQGASEGCCPKSSVEGA